jgi:hypothetical protein
MSLLTLIIARVLAVADCVLSYFVTMTDTGTDLGNATCGVTFDVWNAEMTICGSAFIDMYMHLEYQDLVLDLVQFVRVIT